MGGSVGNRVFSNPKSRVDLEKMVTLISGSHGHYGGKKSTFSYAGRKSPFPAKIGIAWRMKNDSICPNNIRSHFCGLIWPFRAPGRCIWVATLTSYHLEKVCKIHCLLAWLLTYAGQCQYVQAMLETFFLSC